MNTAKVVVTGESGSAPSAVYEHAKRELRKSEKENNPYNHVYCVFDRDSHPTYQGTVEAIRSYRRPGIMHAITSVPCFEYWLLLHFMYSTKQYQRKGKKSEADQMNVALKKHLPEYRKAMPGLFDRLFPKLEGAKDNARKVQQYNQEAATDNPSTMVHELVDYLQNLHN